MLPFPFSKGGLPKWLGQHYFNNDIQKFVHEVMEQSISTSIKNAKMMGPMYDTEEEKPKPLEEEKQSEPENNESFKESLQAITLRVLTMSM